MSVNTLRGNKFLIYVPWFNKAEFVEVSKQIYSDDHSVKRAAFDQMRVWKARCPNLPLAVECTMELVRAQLSENIDESNEEGQPPPSERDLQLKYCNAIMCFVSQLNDSERSQYAMAYRHNITEWIMNFNEETAHGDTLPPLHLLRSAVNVILQWLGEHYWEPEALDLEDYVIKPKVPLELSDVAYFFKVWLSARVYEWGGIERINQLPNEELRVELLTMLTFWYGSDDYEVSSSKYGISEPEQHTLKYVLQIGLNNISDNLEKLMEIKHFQKKYIIEKLLDNGGFLLTDVFLEEGSPVNVKDEEIISVLSYLWYDVLKMLDSKCMTYELLEALVKIIQHDESVHRSHMAALWVSHLTKMFSHHCSQPQNYCHIDVASNSENMYMLNGLKNVASTLENNLCTGVHQILLDRLLAEKGKLPMVALQPLKGLNRCYLVRLVKDIAHYPKKFTSYVLPSLLDLCGEHLPKKSKHDLLAKVGVCTDGPNYEGSSSFSEDMNFDSVKTLRAHEERTKLDTDCCCCENMNNASSDSESEREGGNTNSENWVPYLGNEDWSKCPLGVTPWQRKAMMSSMEQH